VVDEEDHLPVVWLPAAKAWNQSWKDLPQEQIQKWIEAIPGHAKVSFGMTMIRICHGVRLSAFDLITGRYCLPSHLQGIGGKGCCSVAVKERGKKALRLHGLQETT